MQLTLKNGWELVKIVNDKNKIAKELNNLDTKDYERYLVIEDDKEKNCDTPIKCGNLKNLKILEDYER